jgi:tRNA modification GTPase
VLLASYDEGRILRDGLSLVIAGRPNAGKSSLMNRLAGHDRSIVTDIPGTTRDVVESHANLRGLPIRLRDTAGLRESADTVERIGVSRTLEAMDQADLVVAVFDGADLPAGRIAC